MIETLHIWHRQRYPEVFGTSLPWTAQTDYAAYPPELLDIILLNLQPAAAIALSQTSRWYHDHVSLHKLDLYEVQVYLQEMELRSQNAKRDACFSCLRLKPRTSFPRQRANSFVYHGWSLERFCLDCGLKMGKFKPGSFVSIMGEIQSTSLWAVLCSGCMSIQKQFCNDCHWCVGCITKKRTLVGLGMVRRNHHGANTSKDPATCVGNCLFKTRTLGSITGDGSKCGSNGKGKC